MPKNRKVTKVQGGVKKLKVPVKFRIGNRKSAKTAHGMTTEALKEELNNSNHKRSRNKVIAVLRKRGVEIDWPGRLADA